MSQTKNHSTVACDPRENLRTWLFGLGILLGLQLLFAAVLQFQSSAPGNLSSQGPLLAFSPQAVRRLTIASPTREVVLERRDDHWQLPAVNGFPAADEKVTALLEKLARIQRRIPVATSEAAQTRFRVAEDRFERRLVLEDGKQVLGTLYLGDSPGFRRLFVRVSGDSAIYEAALNLFDAGDQWEDWTKKTVLAVPEDQLQGIDGKAFSLRREKDHWTLADLQPGENLDPAAVQKLALGIANLRFQKLLTAKPESLGDQPAQRLQVRFDGKVREYRFFPQGEDFVLKVSDRPEYFQIASYQLEGWFPPKREALLKPEEGEAQTAPPQKEGS